jgi:hypothetical protein
VIGECKWGSDPVARDVLRDLIEQKTPKLLKALPNEGDEWTVQHALFSRAGFTPATQSLAETQPTILVDLDQLARGLDA